MPAAPAPITATSTSDGRLGITPLFLNHKRTRHCEERSDEAIPIGLSKAGRGLLRFARNDSPLRRVSR
jgi:hypothetical protein